MTLEVGLQHGGFGKRKWHTVGVRNGMGESSEVGDFLSKKNSKIPALEDSRRALVGDEVVEADDNQVLEGPESPQEHFGSHLVDH